jgi:hypothetical protein
MEDSIFRKLKQALVTLDVMMSIYVAAYVHFL